MSHHHRFPSDTSDTQDTHITHRHSTIITTILMNTDNIPATPTRVMRAKLKLISVAVSEETPHESEALRFSAVYKSDGYPDNGLDEDNTFAKFTPSMELNMTIDNPALLGKFRPGQKFYVDFTEATS